MWRRGRIESRRGRRAGSRKLALTVRQVLGWRLAKAILVHVYETKETTFRRAAETEGSQPRGQTFVNSKCHHDRYYQRVKKDVAQRPFDSGSEICGEKVFHHASRQKPDCTGPRIGGRDRVYEGCCFPVTIFRERRRGGRAQYHWRMARRKC